MKTLVYILPDKDAGVASVVRNLLRFKTKRYVTKVILLHNELADASRRIQDNFDADDIVRLTYRGNWSSRYSIYRRIFQELDANSVVISNDGTFEIDAVRFFGSNIPIVYIFHGDYKHYYKILERKGVLINKIITVSNYLAMQVQQRFSDQISAHIESIKFPVQNANKFKRISREAISLIFVGSLINAKGVMSLYNITKILDQRSINYFLTIVGSGAQEAELKALFKEHPKVKFTSKLPNDEVLLLFCSQDVILLPSEGEGLPVVLVEAMKHGVVPMATNLKSGIPELIDHKINGFTLGLHDFDGYANHVEHLYNDRSLLRKMSEINIIKAESLFDPYLQTTQYEDAFSEAQPTPHIYNKNFLDYLPITIAHRIKSLIKK